MSIKWGVIGTGAIAAEFIADVLAHTEMSVVAVGSRSRERIANFLPESKFIRCASYEELVETAVDAIYIATPHQVHCENTILALNAKKPVLCEKPFAVNATQARTMQEAAKSNNLLLMEAMWTRYLPHIQKVRELLSELGDIYLVQADHGQAISHIKRLSDPSYAGGALLDLGIYPISFIHMIFGKPDLVVASAILKDGVDLQTSAILSYNDGRQAIMNTNMLVKSPTTATICGTKARLELDTSFYRPTSMRLVYQDGRVVEFANKYQGHGLREEAIYFEKQLILGRKDSELLPIAESISILETLDEIRSQIGLRYPFESI